MPVNSYSINDMRRLASERGGECISDEYVNMNTKLKWKCSQNHIWETTPYVIKMGCWCPKCGARLANKDKLLTIEQMNDIAKENGGKCLSSEYINAHTKLKWQCSKGHIWEAEPTSIIHNHTWCKICSGNGSYIDETKYITYNCDNCGKPTKRYKCQMENNKHKFCSMECRNNFVEADISKDEFFHLYYIQELPVNSIAQIYKVGQQAIYSKVNEFGFKLRDGSSASKIRHKYPENHPNWQGGKTFELYGIEFNDELRDYIRRRDNYTCRECGCTQDELGYTLCVHHIDYDKKNNSKSNLISLCKSCHAKTNYHREDWINYYGGKILYD